MRHGICSIDEAENEGKLLLHHPRKGAVGSSRLPKSIDKWSLRAPKRDVVRSQQCDGSTQAMACHVQTGNHCTAREAVVEQVR
eukprot:Skav217589  [mRNA]  locus=scaffold3512:74423:76055:+ [translate_table: standard]